jgi:hypothetical protein
MLLQVADDVNMLGVMMVHCGDADGMVSGACHTTAATIRPAMQVGDVHKELEGIASLALPPAAVLHPRCPYQSGFRLLITPQNPEPFTVQGAAHTQPRVLGVLYVPARQGTQREMLIGSNNSQGSAGATLQRVCLHGPPIPRTAAVMTVPHPRSNPLSVPPLLPSSCHPLPRLSQTGAGVRRLCCECHAVSSRLGTDRHGQRNDGSCLRHRPTCCYALLFNPGLGRWARGGAAGGRPGGMRHASRCVTG